MPVRFFQLSLAPPCESAALHQALPGKRDGIEEPRSTRLVRAVIARHATEALTALPWRWRAGVTREARYRACAT